MMLMGFVKISMSSDLYWAKAYREHEVKSKFEINLFTTYVSATSAKHYLLTYHI